MHAFQYRDHAVIGGVQILSTLEGIIIVRFSVTVLLPIFKLTIISFHKVLANCYRFLAIPKVDAFL